MALPHDAEKGPLPVLSVDDSLGDREGVHDPDPDPNEVFWDNEADPSNPMNWSGTYRWCHVGFISLLTFVTSLASSMLAPAVHDVMKSLGSDNTKLESFVVSIYVIGFAIGPLIVAPLSELYGRAIVYHVTNVIFLGVTIGCALSKNVGMFLVFRFISGCAGVTPLALGGGTIGDLMPPERMGTAMAVWGLGSLVAPVFSPIAGGYLSQDAGWRWIFWVIAIPMAILTILSPFLIRETYAPVLLEAKTRRLRKETGNPQLKSRLDPGVSRREVILTALIRPPRLLLTSFVVTTIALYVAVVYGYQYLVFTTLAYIFQDKYHMSTGSSGLVYLGTGIGTILGIFAIGFATDKVAERKKKRASALAKDLQPEECLWPMIPSSLVAPIGLFWYGWSLQTNASPVVPLVGLGVFGFAMMGIFQPAQVYLVNSFTIHSASALAAMNILRSLAGGLLPLAGHGLYDALGMGWGNSLLAFIALALAPVPFLLMKYGTKMRKRDRNIK
ncbi:Major facilitator superfamily domain general substrate transporter [Penicillium cf. griseofulvum]|uniref:Major facilitator superfamily domain general substrate transporter n=1 Tax=Penicillium cf. griseofulvum TaxID=2972120 RepID=A0A9W9M3R9_9EURO|nr:Major facilitator superfamily domain general substrate transporter [Penicillium cf. griseofulvum]KAJ5422959.1 Major facilitator superfamily domain general substrate transporter [Penicillium cf. griseofulvum]KAJ5433825.1 Major facilitator superfamily domain general substrate transporter [Penicillium cf. griseofulvum]